MQRAQYPYDDYYLYVVYHKGERRRYACLVPINKKQNKRKTISYARYLMSVKEGRILNSNEYVDHKDDNKMNDDIDNLQILTLAENNRKEAKRHGKLMVELKCPNCKKIFVREKRQTFLQKGGKYKYTSCCRKCSTEFGAKLQHHPSDIKLLTALNENVIKEYRI